MPCRAQTHDRRFVTHAPGDRDLGDVAFNHLACYDVRIDSKFSVNSCSRG
jgi:hypothetical protein